MGAAARPSGRSRWCCREHGWLALAVGAATGLRGAAIAVAATVAVAGYVPLFDRRDVVIH